MSWLDEEPGLAAAVHEVERVFRRARARPVVTLLLAALAALMVVGMAARRVKRYEAQVVLRYTERALADATPLMVRGELQNHVYEVVFARDRLLALMKKHGLYRDELRVGEDVALRAMRLDIDVEEYRNYFLLGDDIPATARVAIGYASPNRDLSTAVALDLAQAVVEYEAERRRASARAASEVARAVLAQATAELDERVAAQRAAEVQLSKSQGAEAARLRVQAAQLSSSVDAHRILVEQAEARLEDARVALGAEERQLALGVEVARISIPPRPPSSRKRLFLVLGALGFVFALPLCAIFVGAMDSRVQELEDVERIGIPGLGRVPTFAGSDDGTLAQRMSGTRPRAWRGLLRGRSRIRASRR